MINRVEKTRDYSVIANTAANDERLSLKAKGLFFYLMTKPDSWQISYRGVMSQLREGEAAVRAAFKELEVCGYIVRSNARQADGRFAPEVVLHEKPCLENPGPDTHGLENPVQVNTNVVNTQEVRTELVAPSEQRPQPDKRRPEINDVLDYWQATTGIPVTSNVQKNRYAVANLLKKHGPEGLQKLIRMVAAATSDPYAPRIADPVQLQARLSDVLLWAKKRQDTIQNQFVDVDAVIAAQRAA